jgi:large subunit ribosomal protein L19
MYLNRIVERLQKQTNHHLQILSPGDTVRIGIRIQEGTKLRIQVSQGILIHRSRKDNTGTITTRRLLRGVNVERNFLVHAPRIEYVEVLLGGKVRRAKLYYLRMLKGKIARVRKKCNTISKSLKLFSNKSR